MANLRVVACNSGCCAIKHIRDFPYSPTQNIYMEFDGHDEDQETTEPEPYLNFLSQGGDLQNGYMIAGDAFRAIVAAIKDRREAGMITVNLATEQNFGIDGEVVYETNQLDAWTPLLEELGFKSVQIYNSNSENIVHHFTLIYGENPNNSF